MIAKRMRAHHANASLAKFSEKVGRPGDAAEGEARFLRLRRDDSAEHSPPVFVSRPRDLRSAAVMYKCQRRRPGQRGRVARAAFLKAAACLVALVA